LHTQSAVLKNNILFVLLLLFLSVCVCVCMSGDRFRRWFTVYCNNTGSSIFRKRLIYTYIVSKNTNILENISFTTFQIGTTQHYYWFFSLSFVFKVLIFWITINYISNFIFWSRKFFGVFRCIKFRTVLAKQWTNILWSTYTSIPLHNFIQSYHSSKL